MIQLVQVNDPFIPVNILTVLPLSWTSCFIAYFIFIFLMNVYFDGIMDLATLVKHGSCISLTKRGQGR